MSVYKITFSPAGGTSAVANALCTAWSGDGVQRIDLTKQGADFSSRRFGKDDLCVIALPVYEGRVAPTALERLSQMRGDNTPAVFAVVYGNRHFNDALLELEDALTELGFVPVAGVTANARHSILREYGAGRPDEDDRKELADFSRRIKAALDAGTAHFCPEVPGKRPYIVIQGKTAPPEFDASKCTYCGHCVDLCPVKALDMEIHTDVSRCIRCMRCVAICPHDARFIPQARIDAAKERLGKYFEGRKPNCLYLENG